MRRLRVRFFAALGTFSLGAGIGMALVIWLSVIPFAWWWWLLGGVWLGFAAGVFVVALWLTVSDRRAAARRRGGFDMAPLGRRAG